MAQGRMRATIVLDRPMWSALPPVPPSAAPRVLLSCPGCGCLIRYAGLLTRDGFGIEAIQCQCKAEFTVLLQGWRERGN